MSVCIRSLHDWQCADFIVLADARKIDCISPVSPCHREREEEKRCVVVLLICILDIFPFYFIVVVFFFFSFFLSYGLNSNDILWRCCCYLLMHYVRTPFPWIVDRTLNTNHDESYPKYMTKTKTKTRKKRKGHSIYQLHTSSYTFNACRDEQKPFALHCHTFCY